MQIVPIKAPETSNVNYDAALAAIGYESRSRFFFKSNVIKVKKPTACIFPNQQVLDFSTNKQFFIERGFDQIEANVASVKKWARETCLTKTEDPNSLIQIIVDISAMTRELISAVVFYLFYFAKQSARPVTADFVYSIAEFGTIPSRYGPVTWNGPSITEFAGWPKRPKVPCGIVIGIGYEEDLALGIIEDLEAARVWAFLPGEHDSRYDEAIKQKNKGLFEEIPPQQVIGYSVYDPYSLFVKLEALLGLSKRDTRLLVVPFGPKIFALSSCLAALLHYPEIGIWRVSGGSNQEPVERKAAGPIPSIKVIF